MRFLIYCLFFSILLLLASSNVSFGQDLEFEPGLTKAEYDEYVIGITLANVGEIDRKNGQYFLDFWVYIETENQDFIKNPPKIEFLNEQIDKISSEYVESQYYEARVSGNFHNDMDFSNFPFEEIILKISIEPSIPQNIDTIRFSSDKFSSVIRSVA